MKKYEICVVSKEYRYVTVEAETAEDAKDKVWDMLGNGLDGLGYTGEVGVDTDLLVEGVVTEETENG